MAGELLQEAQHALDACRWTSGELQLLTVELTEALTNVHRIAVSRGARLPAPVHEDRDAFDQPNDEDNPQHPAQPAPHD